MAGKARVHELAKKELGVTSKEVLAPPPRFSKSLVFDENSDHYDPCAEGGTWDGHNCVSQPGDLPWCSDTKCAPQLMDPCPIPGAVPHGGPCWVTSTPTPTPTRWGLPPAEWHCLPTDPNPEQASPDPRCENW